MPSSWLTRCAGLVLLVAVPAGCSSTGGSSLCIGSEDPDGGEVCAERADGSVQIDASGLLPGSDLLVEVEAAAEPQAYPVGEDGTPDGTIRLVAASPGGPLRIKVRAVGAGSDEFEGELTLP